MTTNVTTEVAWRLGLSIAEEPVRPMLTTGKISGQYYCFDDGTAEIEVLEFLYALVRLVKPENILETGTYWGLSTGYMALGLRDNKMGHLDTVEWESQHIDKANISWDILNVEEYITCHYMSSLEFKPERKYELVFLDTEPQIRFAELDRFWDNIIPGGIIVIHDLNWNMGEGNQFWLHFDLIKDKIKNHQLTVISFNTPRGLVLLRKTNEGPMMPDYVYHLLKDK